MRPLKVTFIALTFLCLVIGCASNPKPAKVAGIPVIFDTDIGDDIDDTWALGFLLRSPELDVKLVVGDDGKSEYRAKLLAKFLETAGRTDIPVGIGMEVPSNPSNGRGQRCGRHNIGDARATTDSVVVGTRW